MRSKLPECVNKDCDTSTKDNIGIGMLKLVFTFKYNIVSIYSIKCFKISRTNIPCYMHAYHYTT